MSFIIRAEERTVAIAAGVATRAAIGFWLAKYVVTTINPTAGAIVGACTALGSIAQRAVGNYMRNSTLQEQGRLLSDKEAFTINAIVSIAAGAIWGLKALQFAGLPALSFTAAALFSGPVFLAATAVAYAVDRYL